MELELEVHKCYIIEDKILKEYIEYCKENDMDYEDFDNFIQYFLNLYYKDDFLESEDEFWNAVNNSFNINFEFSKEIERLKND